MRADGPGTPGGPVPDHLPEELVSRYGREARRAVKGRRPARGLARAAAAGLRDGDVWALTLTVFLWSALAVGFIGGLVFAVARWPWVGLYVVGPILSLLALSFGVALWLIRRRRRGKDLGVEAGSGRVRP